MILCPVKIATVQQGPLGSRRRFSFILLLPHFSLSRMPARLPFVAPQSRAGRVRGKEAPDFLTTE